MSVWMKGASGWCYLSLKRTVFIFRIINENYLLIKMTEK
ncbi:hypothetical protein ATN83_1050 [Raoultella ornithinolytica]|nr:hypothetical protein ATN83_1050 [Raoultella ornithinolytica]KDV92114.1 hypothetical protein AB00_3822 [Raoultella ornithinolytica 2-156-04_S1_C1]KDX12587.1 hypothetical protein AB28_3828 [Raoultella ornithinolytica 2-156-04_S1_C2]